ncbi:DUF2157 domain-containing protein [Candidatus Peregrinibacteria bacterium]|jgi:uncharacterized membrane protein|nr:DUF2157 domain-containing protein [Candidatus Peregrinibacteria bacterium]MBT5468844.1 DUF2157 domain-containing protein [Candidatus Peregrinibacteria bacterium]MBT7337996.1 DUF2157 domain-containing protein [Candidatus Peregrinibacteria bacterium]
MNWTVDQALAHWQEKGFLDKKKATELKNSLSNSDHMDTHGMPRAVSIFATIGAILVGLGILLFIGSHWSNMTPVLRILTVFAGYIVVVLGAYVTENRGLNGTSEALWLLADIVFGANIMLLAQIFHYSLTFWQGPFLWMIGTLAMGYARQQKVHGFLAVPLGILALGWLDSTTGWGFGAQMEFLASHNNLLPVLSLLGIGLVSLSLIVRQYAKWNFVYQPLLAWGALLTAAPLVISTIDSSIPEEMYTLGGTVKQYVVIGLSYALASIALWKSNIKRSEPKLFMLTLAILLGVLLIQARGQSMVGSMLDYNPVMYFLYVLVIFALSLWAVWIGMLVQNSRLFNIGIITATIIIVIQYFSWSFILLDKSIAFILGGILLITMTIFIEKKRRKILSTFNG